MRPRALHPSLRSPSPRGLRSSRLSRALLLLLTAMICPLTAQAQQEEFDRYFTAAGQLYESLEYERALEQLDRARKLTQGVQQDVAVALQEGIILGDMGHREQSLAAFKTALLLDPKAVLPTKVSPKVEKDFEAVRIRVLKDLASRPRPPKSPAPSAVSPLPVSPSPSLVSTPQTPLAPAGTGLNPVAEPSGPTTLSQPSHSQRWILPAASGAMALTGGVFYGLARNERSRLRSGDASLGSLEASQTSASRGRTYQTVSAGLVGAGVVGLGVSLALQLLRDEPAVAITGGGTDGRSAFIQGTWP
jgi:hypothetical protein